MTEDLSQDDMSSINAKPSENSSSVNDDSLDWAKQAYLKLKQKQKEEKELQKQEIEKQEILNQTKNEKEDFKLISSDVSTPPPSQDPIEEEPKLGDFDDTFTWSAEVLAAQGKKIDQFSLDEIDWLGRL